jgi:very-short-patch-repair endonuclease
MRREPTDAEKKLWSRLRDRQIGGFKFRRQVPLGGYILDYFCKEAKLGVELDGGQHADAEEARYDAGRDEALRKLGVEVLRFPDDEAIKDTDAVLARILEIALARKALRE